MSETVANGLINNKNIQYFSSNFFYLDCNLNFFGNFKGGKLLFKTEESL
jgi:hypothetical protein